eukprot:4867366-Amphidinium_carterae.1
MTLEHDSNIEVFWGVVFESSLESDLKAFGLLGGFPGFHNPLSSGGACPRIVCTAASAIPRQHITPKAWSGSSCFTPVVVAHPDLIYTSC